jgi:hypothetical protein
VFFVDLSRASGIKQHGIYLCHLQVQANAYHRAAMFAEFIFHQLIAVADLDTLVDRP